jgi:hypothetical protein
MVNLREFPTSQVATLMSESSLGQLPPGYDNLQRRVHEAMVQYRVKDAIIHRFDPRPHCFPDAIHATTQDRPGRLAIWLVRRGRSLLPWHGVDVWIVAGAQRLYMQQIFATNITFRLNSSQAKEHHSYIGK